MQHAGIMLTQHAGTMLTQHAGTLLTQQIRALSSNMKHESELLHFGALILRSAFCGQQCDYTPPS
jgi:hypothetical protein